MNIGIESLYVSVNIVNINGSAIKISKIVAGKNTNANFLILFDTVLCSDKLPSLWALDIIGVTI